MSMTWFLLIFLLSVYETPTCFGDSIFESSFMIILLVKLMDIKMAKSYTNLFHIIHIHNKYIHTKYNITINIISRNISKKIINNENYL